MKSPDEKKGSFSEALKNLEAISVREEQGLRICRELGCDECRVNIDPTFLLSKNEWLKVIKKPKQHLPGKYDSHLFLGQDRKRS